MLFGKTLKEVKSILSALNPINFFKSIFKSEDITKIYNTDALIKFNNALDQGKTRAQAWMTSVHGMSKSTQQAAVDIYRIREECSKNNVSMQVQNERINAVINSTDNLSASQKAAAASANLLRGALSFIGQVGIMLAISAIIKGISWLIERQKQFKQSIDDVNSSAQKLRDTLKELSDHSDTAKEFVELSKGVNSLGENVSLTTEEFDRYHQIVNQIAEDCPDRVKGYDDEGNAILDLKETVESLTAAYRIAKQEAISESYYSKEGTKQRKDALKNAYNNLGLGYFNTDAQGYKISEGITKIQQKEFLENVLKKTKEDLLDDYNNIALSPEEFQLLFGLGITKEKIEENYELIRNQLKSQVNKLNTEINKSAKAVKEILNQSLWVDIDFQNLSEREQTALSVIVQNLSPERLGELAQGGEQAVQDYVSTLIDSYTTAVRTNGVQIEDAKKKLLGLDFSKLSISEAKSKIDTFYQDVADMLGDQVDSDTARLLYPVDIDFDGKSIDELFAKSEALKQQIADRFYQVPTEGDAEAIDSVFDELNLRTEEEMTVFSKLLVQYNNLTDAKEAYKDMTQEEKEAMADLHDTFTYTDYADQIETINKNVDALDKALETLKKGESLDNSDIDNLVKLFPEYSTNILAASNDTKQLEAELVRIRSGAAADFVETLRSLKGLSEEEQQAVDNLIKRYSDYSYKLDSATSTSMSYADMLKEISDKESLLDSVHKEMNSDGQISVSTYQKLIEAGQDYADLVEIENGVITVSEDKIKSITKKKLEDEIATLQLALAEERYNSAMANRGLSVKTEKEAELEADIEAKKKLIDAWNNYTPSDSGGGSNNNEAKKQYSQELQLLKDQLNDRVITYEQFLQRWQALNDKYHKMSEEEGGISDYEYNQNNRDIIEERTKAYEEEKKNLQELYEAGKISLDEYNVRVDTALNHWLGGYAQLSDDFKEQAKDNAEFAKTHFFDKIDRELENLQNKYDKTGDITFLDSREKTARSGYDQATAKLNGLYAQGYTDANEDVQFWLDKQKKYNDTLDNILSERTNIIKDNVDKQVEAIDKETEKYGDKDNSKLLNKIGIYEQAKVNIQSQINDYLARGYGENSDEVKALVKQIEDYDEDIVNVYKSIGDRIESEKKEQLDAIDREIKQTGDTSKYQIKLNILADTKKEIQDLIETFKELGFDANSEVIKDLESKITELDDEIIETTQERTDAQIKAYEEVMELETKQLEKYKKEQDEIFDAKIKALEDEKKALEKQNDEIEKQEKKQEKIKSILDAQRGIYKSLKMVYSGNGGWSIKPSQESLDTLKDAEKDLAATEREEQIKAVDELIDGIKEQKDTFDTAIDKQTQAIEDGVQTFKDTLETSYKTYAQLDSTLLTAILGEDSAKEYITRFNEIAEKYDINQNTTDNTATESTQKQAQANQEVSETVNQATNSVNKLNGATNNLHKSSLKAEAELNSFADDMQKEFGLGNVDLTKRPFVSGDKMRKAGYDVDANGTSTVYSGTEFLWQGDEENGKYVAVHYTPILPNGEVLTEKEMRDYLYNVLEGSEDILKADIKGLVLKVDTDLNVSEKDMKSLETGKLTKHMKDILALTDEWDIALHEIQEEWMNMYFKVHGNPSEKSIDLKGGKNYTGLLGFVQSFLNGTKSITSLATDMSAVNQLGSATKMMGTQNINSNNFAPVITNNFTITTPNGNADEIKNAVNEIVDTKIVAGFKAFYDGYYQQSMKEMYGH